MDSEFKMADGELLSGVVEAGKRRWPSLTWAEEGGCTS